MDLTRPGHKARRFVLLFGLWILVCFVKMFIFGVMDFGDIKIILNIHIKLKIKIINLNWSVGRDASTSCSC